MTDDLGGLGALLLSGGVGAAVVTAVALFVRNALQWGRDHRAEERKARAAARILRGDFLMWQRAIAKSLDTGKWWQATDVQPSYSSPDDLRSLAERRRHWDEWKVIGYADRKFRSLESKRENSSGPDEEELREVSYRLERARKQLSAYDGHSFTHYERFFGREVGNPPAPRVPRWRR